MSLRAFVPNMFYVCITKSIKMAYSELLADRIRLHFDTHQVGYREMKMMGGLCFMVDEKMCVGVVKEDLMARIGTEIYDEAVKKPGARPMDFTKRPMKGYVFVEPEGVDMDDDLSYWLELALAFNPLAKASKKKKKK